MDIAVILVNIGHVIKAICLLLSTTLQTPKKAPQKLAQIDQKVKEKTMILYKISGPG